MDSKEAATRIRAASRKAITLPSSGAEMVIRKLQPYDFIGEGVTEKFIKRLEIPTKAMTPDKSGGARTDRDLEFEKAYLQLVVARAAVAPRVIIDGGGMPQDDEVAFSDLGADAEYIFAQALEYAGMTGKAEVVERFREVQGEESRCAGQDGEAVRGTSA